MRNLCAFIIRALSVIAKSLCRLVVWAEVKMQVYDQEGMRSWCDLAKFNMARNVGLIKLDRELCAPIIDDKKQKEKKWKKA